MHCIFCPNPELEIIQHNELCIAIRDKFPIRPLHTLIIPRRHFADYFDMSGEEAVALLSLARICAAELRMLDPSIAGFNFGANIGHIAGQKIDHAHLHLIPRRVGDTPPPPARPDNN